MLAEVLAPGVQHRGHAQFAAEATAVLAEAAQGVPGDLEQLPMEQLGVQLHPAVQGVQQGEHHMNTTWK
jgi:hypothetical protein